MKTKIIIILCIIIVGTAAIFVVPAMTSKTKTYTGVLKEPWSKVFGSGSSGADTRYIVPLMIKDSLTGKEKTVNFIIEQGRKEGDELYQFIKDNVGEKVFITTKKAVTYQYERITEVVIK